MLVSRFIRNIDKELYKQARIEALKANMSIGAWLNLAIKFYLRETAISIRPPKIEFDYK